MKQNGFNDQLAFLLKKDERLKENKYSWIYTPYPVKHDVLDEKKKKRPQQKCV